MMKNYYEILNIKQDVTEEELYKNIKKKISYIKNTTKNDNLSSKTAGRVVIVLCEAFLLTLKHYGSKENYDRALKMKYNKKVKQNKKTNFNRKFALVAAGLVMSAGITIAAANLETTEIPVYTGQTLSDICIEYNIGELEIIGDGFRTKDYEYQDDDTLTVVSTDEKIGNINSMLNENSEVVAESEIETYTFKYIVKSGDTATGLIESLRLVDFGKRELWQGEELTLKTTDFAIAEEMKKQYGIDTAKPFPTEYEYYEVQPGDSISKIAAKFGVTSERIVDFNMIPNINGIQVGTKIIIVYEYVTGAEAVALREQNNNSNKSLS